MISGEYHYVVDESEEPTRPKAGEVVFLTKLLAAQNMLEGLIRNVSEGCLESKEHTQNLAIGLSILTASVQEADDYLQRVRDRLADRPVESG